MSAIKKSSLKSKRYKINELDANQFVDKSFPIEYKEVNEEIFGYNAPNCATHFAPYSASHFAPNCATFHNE